jgi:hypothetical protein
MCQFFKQLDGAESRFSVVADYFGRGVFNKVGRFGMKLF